MEEKKKGWKNSVLSMGILLFLAGVTGCIVLKDRSVSDLWLILKSADLRFAALGLGCMVLFVGCEAAIIRLLARTWNDKVPWRRAMGYSFAGFYFSSITPSSTGGQPMQLYYMVRDGMGAARGSFILLTITAMYQLTALFYGGSMAVMKHSVIAGLPVSLKFLLGFGVLVNGASAVLICLILFRRQLVEHLVSRVLALLGKLHIIKDPQTAEEKAAVMIEEYSQGGRYLRKHPLAAVWTAVLTYAQLTFLYLASYCAALALGLGSVGLLNFLMLQSVVSLAVSSVPLPGAVGASEGGFLMMFRHFFPPSELLPVMLLGRGISFYGFLLISGLAVFILQARRTISVSPGPQNNFG